MMNKKVKSLLILALILAAIIGLFKLANYLGSGEKGEGEKPLVICNPPNAPPEQQKCFWTADIHVMIKAFKGNTEIPIGFEQGNPDGHHTHAELNKIHWHGLIPVDPKTKEVKNWSALEVGKIPGDLKLSAEGTPKFIINGKEVQSSYVWQEEDTLEIHYE